MLLVTEKCPVVKKTSGSFTVGFPLHKNQKNGNHATPNLPRLVTNIIHSGCIILPLGHALCLRRLVAHQKPRDKQSPDGIEPFYAPFPDAIIILYFGHGELLYDAAAQQP